MKKTKSEHALALFRAGVSAVPIVGGSVASLIGDYIPTATQKVVEHALEHLKKRLEEVSERLDLDAVNKDDFAELFKSYYLILVRSHREERTSAATELVINILLKEDDPEKLDYTELDHFARCLEALSIGAISLLANSVVAARQYRRKMSGARPYSFEFRELQMRMPDYDPDLLMGLVAELDSMNLLHISAVPAIQIADYGNYKLQLTRLGVRFTEHLLREKGLSN